MTITLGSLFDGSGGFPLAGSLCGIVPMWASEIEPYPIAVTKSRFPNMKHLGDISRINGSEIEPVDIITFGSPCQDLSVAGKRAGLKHEANGDEKTTRSGLFMEAIRIIKEMRCATNGKYPRFALWENVPGAFSSNKGEDFRIVLEELIKISEAKATVPPAPKGGWPYADAYVGDGWSLAYRTFDAQYWGVPQRRRRIYLVADFAGGCATRVLFEREGVRGYFTEGKSPWQSFASNLERSTGTDDSERVCISFHLTQDPISNQKISHCISSGNSKNGQSSVGICYPLTLSDKASTLRAGAGAPKHKSDFVGRLVLHPIAFALNQRNEVRNLKDKAGALAAQTGMKQQTFITVPVINTNNVFEDGNLESDVINTLPVAYSFDSLSSNSMKSKNPYSGCRQVEVAKTLDTTDPSPNKNQGGMALVQPLVLFEPRSQDGVPRIHKKVSPTLNTAQGGQRQPCVAMPLKQHPFCKSARPSFKGDSETYIDCKVSNTLNTFDLGDKRANELVVETLPVFCVQGNCIDRADTAGCNGKGWREGSCFTLNTIDRPAVAYLASGKNKVGTLMANCGTKQWLGNQEAFSGDYHIVEEISQVYRQGSFADYIEGEFGTLQAFGGDLGGGLENIVKIQYIVRRLTPTECARLQGFADNWAAPDSKEDFTDEEYHFWLEVRNNYAMINGRKIKEYTKPQMITWYNKLHSASSEYKMWGNGIALPPTLYCMQGLYDALSS